MSPIKKKLLYINPYEKQLKGIEAKINAQIVALSHGHTVTSKAVTPERRGPVATWVKLCREVVISLSILRYNTIYYRYAPSCPILNIAITVLSFFSSATIWIEYNATEDEIRPISTRLWLMHRISRGFLICAKARHLPITKEMGEIEHLPNAVPLGNGYVAPSTKAELRPELVSRIVAAKKNAQQLFTFVASQERPWHGVDRILNCIETCQNSIVILVGDFNNTDHLLQMEANGNVIRTGELAPDVLWKIYELCDYGLSAFAEDRRQQEEGANLKVREYLYYGLPVLVTYRDPLLHDDWCHDFLIKIDPKDSNALASLPLANFDRASLRAQAPKKLSWVSVFERVGVLEKA